MVRIAGLILGLLYLLNPSISLGNDSEPVARQTVRTDGSELAYHLQRQNDGPQGLLLLLQGSGCDSVTTRKTLLRDGLIIRPSYAQLTIEKYGVLAGATNPDDCTSRFWRHNTIQQRLLDALQVIAELRNEPWWNGDLVIFGGSEGGAVAAILAPLVPETDAAIVFSSGIGWRIEDMIRAAIPPQASEQVDAIFGEARSNPTGEKQWGGASYRWWADSLDLVPAQALVGSEFPLLLVHGERDQFAPVETARAAAKLWSDNNRPDTTYREYPGYDHFMIDAENENHNGEVMADIEEWLGRQIGGIE